MNAVSRIWKAGLQVLKALSARNTSRSPVGVIGRAFGRRSTDAALPQGSVQDATLRLRRLKLARNNGLEGLSVIRVEKITGVELEVTGKEVSFT
jgi:hypothetical protein